jgi:UDP-N-acetyl-D-glucosamine dehydrogenase
MPARKLVVVGQGYVGLPLAMRAVEVGYTVVGLEVDPARVANLAAGRSQVEDVTGLQLRNALDSQRYVPTTDVTAARGFDVAVITVPTPLRDGNPDLSFIEDAGRSVAPNVTRGATVVLESTTYPGTTTELLAPILENGSGLTVGTQFFLGYSPERIDPGNSTWGLVNTPKVVSGVDAASLERVDAFYRDIVEVTVPVASPREAELTKLLENTFRHVNIALVNELAMFAHDLDIDVWQAIEAASTKPFGYMRFTPGPGVGGHCLPIDPSYLSWRVKRQLGQPFRFVELANDVNDHMPNYVVQRATAALNAERKAVNGSSILVLGLAYKQNTGDARESPSIRIVQLLHQLGAHVRAVDPHVNPAALRESDAFPAVLTDLSSAEVSEADLVVLLVDHTAFDYSLLADARVLDTRHVVPRADKVELL